MTQVDLKEYAPTDHALTAAQRDALLREAGALDLSIEPIVDREGSYRLTAGPRVGALRSANCRC